MPDSLLPDQKLLPDQALTSQSGQFELKYLLDGNLIVYDTTILPLQCPESVRWSAGTAGHNPGFLLFQKDGNLVLYNHISVGFWSTGTWLPTKKGTHLVLQDDGNLVLYGIAPLFTSFTDPNAISHGPAAPAPAPANPSGNGINLADVVQEGAKIFKIVLSLF